jgi:hypothetical protein
VPVENAIVDVGAPSAAAAGRGRRGRFGFVVSCPRIAARLLTALAVVLLIVGLSAARARADSPAAGTAFSLPADGFDPDVAVDDDGTANVVWTHQNAATTSDTLEYCQIPRGKTTCAQRDSFTPALPASASKAEGRPRVLLPGADHVVLLTHRTGLVDFNALTGAIDANCAEDGGCVAEDHLTWAYESFDDGQTFQAPEVIGVVPTEGGAISFSPTPPFALESASSTPPNNAPVTAPTSLVGGVSSGFESTAYNLGFQAAPLNSTMTFDVADLGAGQTAATDNAAVGVTPAGQPLVLGHFAGGLIWSRWNGGPLDDVISSDSSTNWSGGPFSGGEWPTLASGSGGLYALSSTSVNPDNDQFVVQKYNGAATGVPFTSPTAVASGVAAELGSDLEEDTGGQLYGVVVARSGGTDGLHLLESADGKTWSTTSLASTETNGIQRPTVSAASDGGGLAVYASGQGENGRLTAVPFGSAAPAPGQIDVRVNAMEITQGVQTFELPTRNPVHPLDNNVNYHGVPVPNTGKTPVIVKMADDNHPTVVRVYANTRNALPPKLVPAMTLRAFRDGKELYPGPIQPDVSYDSSLKATHQVPADAQTQPADGYTFTIPALWTSGDITFQAEINPAGDTPSVAQCARCRQYNILRLGPIHFTKIDEIAAQPVALDSKNKDGSPMYPLGGLDPDPPYTPQSNGLASSAGAYNLTADLGSGKASVPPPFAGMRAVTPFTYHVNPYFYVADASGVLRNSNLSYATQSSKLADIVSDWAEHRFGCDCWYVPGLVPSASGFSGGVTPDTSDSQLYGDDDPAVGVWSDDRPVNASSHEFGHSIGRVHAGLNCGSNTKTGGAGEAWAPDNNGNFYGVGLDTTAPSPYRILSWAGPGSKTTDSSVTAPASPPSAFYDLMSYCGSALGNADHWVSVTNWNRAVDFGASHVGRSAARSLHSQLSLAHDAGRSAASRVAFAHASSASHSLSVTTSNDILANQAQVTDVHPATGSPKPAAAASMYALRALDASGHVIATDAAKAGLSRVEPSPHVAQTPSIVRITGLIQAGAHAVQVLENGQVIATRTASAHAPTVKVTSPRRGQRAGAGGHTLIRWNAADSDHDALTASVDYSANAGRTWVSIYQGPAGPGRVTLPSRLLAHSSGAMVRVSVNDGFHQTSANSSVFRAVGAPPTVMVTAPQMHARVAAGGNLNLAATAYDDHQRQLPGRAIHWTAGRFVVGTGEALTADNLPAGHYRLTATATDSSGRKGSASVPIVVQPAKPLLRVFKVPHSISRRAKTLKIKAAAVTPVILAVGRHQFLVTRAPSTVAVPIAPGRKRLSLHVVLRSGSNVVKLAINVSRH